MSTTAQKDERIGLRVAPDKKELIAYVAQATNMTLSAFILESAYNKAQEILASKTHFMLPEEQWKKFNALLDEPPRDIPELRKLFEAPNIFNK